MSTFKISKGDVAYIFAQIALMNAELAGMLAQNQICMVNNEPFTFGDKEFCNLRLRYEARIGPIAITEMDYDRRNEILQRKRSKKAR